MHVLVGSFKNPFYWLQVIFERNDSVLEDKRISEQSMVSQKSVKTINRILPHKIFEVKFK